MSSSPVVGSPCAAFDEINGVPARREAAHNDQVVGQQAPPVGDDYDVRLLAHQIRQLLISLVPPNFERACSMPPKLRLDYGTSITSARLAFRPDGCQLVQSGYSTLCVWQTELTKSTATKMPKLELASNEQRAAQTALARDWHSSERARAAGNQDWHAAAFHLTRLQEIELDEPDHLARRGVAYAELGRLDEALDDWDNCFDRFTQPDDLVELLSWSGFRRARPWRLAA